MKVTPVQTTQGRFLNHLKEVVNYESHIGTWDNQSLHPYLVNFENLTVLDHRLQSFYKLPPLATERELIYLWEFESFLGSHPTNFAYSLLMLYSMNLLDFSSKTVLDLGSAEGILDILALKNGAAKTFAIDNDPYNGELLIKNLGLNDLSLSLSTFFAEDLRDIERILTLIENQQIDIVLANLGPHYGSSHLAAIEIIKRLPSVQTVVLAGYCKNSQFSAEESLIKLATMGFRKNFKTIRDPQTGKESLIIDR